MSAGLYLRRAGKVRALHLSSELSLDELLSGVADFVSLAPDDFDVKIKPSSIVLTNRKGGFRLDAAVGDWLVITENDELAVYGNDEFNSIHEYLTDLH